MIRVVGGYPLFGLAPCRIGFRMVGATLRNHAQFYPPDIDVGSASGATSSCAIWRKWPELPQHFRRLRLALDPGSHCVV